MATGTQPRWSQAYRIAQIYLGCKRFDDADAYVVWVRYEARVVCGR